MGHTDLARPDGPSEFRFLVLCRHFRQGGSTVSLGDVLSVVHVPDDAFPYDLRPFAAIGAILLPPMWGKRLDLVAWKLGAGGEQAPVSCTGTLLVLPQEAGAVVLSYPVTIQVQDPGFYGIDLVDAEGAFGPAGHHVASYQFTVQGSKPS